MIVLRIDTEADAGILTPLALMSKRFPGVHRIQVVTGDRRLTLGPDSAVDPSEACLAALREFGAVEILTDFAGGEGTGPLDAGPVSRPDLEAEHGEGP